MQPHPTADTHDKDVLARLSAGHPGAGRAWGKVILLGEHAVVYGVPALAIGIDRGAHATLEANAGAKSVLAVPAWELVVPEGDTESDLGRAFSALVAASRAFPGAVVHRSSVRVSAHAELPPGGGLGCSAALGVAVARALVPGLDSAEAAGLAMAWERVFHGNPSGIDAEVAARGGSILFEKGRPMENVPIGSTLTVCLGSTGVASSTKTMVEGVARLRERKPDVVDKAFQGIASLVRNARLAVEAGDNVGLGRLMDLNQMILSGLFLSTEQIELLCSSARDAGALGAKLTGAGGGGSVVALARDAESADGILAAWQAAGFSGFTASVRANTESS
jgi:mevalonate kinase